MFARAAVPLLMFIARILVTSAATPSERTRLRCGLPRASDLPSGKTTFLMAIGSVRGPPDADRAVASALSGRQTPAPGPPRPPPGRPARAGLLARLFALSR